jgi:hypothetical protein
MTTKSLLMLGALALSSLAMAGTKTYSIQFDTPVMAGNAQIQAGEYKLTVEGGNAIFTNVQNEKKFTAPVKTEIAPKKFDTTSMETSKQGDNERLQYIEIGGSTTKLEFGE